MLFTEEKYPTPVGHIKLVSHFGDPIVRPWRAEVPDCETTDPRFGYLDLSNVEVLHDYSAKNLIVNQSSVLMARRMAPGNLGTAGIGYLAVGTGYGTGSTSAPQAEDPTYKKLRNEVFRKAITSWTFLDATGNPVASPPDGVGRIQYTTTFGPTEANYDMVEMGLMGGDATSTKDTGTMYNYKVFKVWSKTADLNASLTVIWTLLF